MRVRPRVIPRKKTTFLCTLRFSLVFVFVLLTVLSFSVFAECQQNDGDFNGDLVVNKVDLDIIKEKPSFFWSLILQKNILSLNQFMVKFSQNFGTSCPIKSGKPTPPLNVKDLGATGNGLANDAPAFQKALDSLAKQGGGGSLFLPAGTYFLDQTLLIGDNTEIYGEKEKTILKRGNTKSFGLPMYGGTSDCEKNLGFSGYELFRNNKYNCGNEKIFLHDFSIDGSLVQTGPEAVTIAFSAVKDLRIEGLSIRNVPQDGIFIRNGGERTVIKNNLIDGHNMRWFNGGGINIEMHGNGNYPPTKEFPALIEDNTIIMRAFPFCRGSETKTCYSDNDCNSDSSCGTNIFGIVYSNIIGILVTWIDGDSAPVVNIKNNKITVDNGHVAISCHGCRDSSIENNVIEFFDVSKAGGAGGFSPVKSTVLSGRFMGIISDLPSGGYGKDIIISKNTILGSGKPKDGRAILLSSNHQDSVNAEISNNIIKNKNMASNLGAIVLHGYHDFKIIGNQISSIFNGPAMEIGGCEEGLLTTKSGEIKNNAFKDVNPLNPNFAAIVLKKTEGITLTDNSISPVSEIQRNLPCSETE